MKNILPLLSLAVALSASAFAAAASPAVLAQSTKNGNTTVITVARFGADPTVTADGTVPVTIYPRITVLDSTGTVISEKFDGNGSFTTTLSPSTVALILTEIKAAYDADVAAKAEAAAKAATPPSTSITLPKTSNLVFHDTSEANAPRNTGAIYLRDHGVAISSEGKIYLTPEARKRLASN